MKTVPAPGPCAPPSLQEQSPFRCEVEAILAWQALPNVTPTQLVRLMEKVPSLEALWGASAQTVAQLGVLSEKQWRHWQTLVRQPVNRIPAIRSWRSKGEALTTLTWRDTSYPTALREIHNPPALLFASGDSQWLQATPQLAVVGTRQCTAYGEQATHWLVESLTGTDVVITSGLAAGIDTAAHEAALAVGLPTIAVFGCGLDMVYPAANQRLAEAIVESGGLLLSEYPPGTPPVQYRFPQRNRIVVGLSQAVLVVEAPEKSGAMITARLALEENRTLVAVPGPIDSPMSQGPLALIRQGASPVYLSNHLREELGLPCVLTEPLQQRLAFTETTTHLPTTTSSPPTRQRTHQLLATPHHTSPSVLEPPGSAHSKPKISSQSTAEEFGKDDIDWLQQLPVGQPVSVDWLAQHCGCSVATLGSQLTLLEIEGRVALLAGAQVKRLV